LTGCQLQPEEFENQRYPTRRWLDEKESLTPGSSQERLYPQGEKHGEENRRLHQAASASW
jgi:hypothetical protein